MQRINKFAHLIPAIEAELSRRVEEWGTAARKANATEYEGNLNRYFALEAVLIDMRGHSQNRVVDTNAMRIEVLRFAGNLQRGVLLHTDKREQARAKSIIKGLTAYAKEQKSHY